MTTKKSLYSLFKDELLPKFALSSKTLKIKFGIEFWEELKSENLNIIGYEFRIDQLPLKIDYISTSIDASYIHLTGFFLLKEASEAIENLWN